MRPQHPGYKLWHQEKKNNKILKYFSFLVFGRLRGEGSLGTLGHRLPGEADAVLLTHRVCWAEAVVRGNVCTWEMDMTDS